MATTPVQQEALTRAVSGQSMANYRDIFEGFIQKGIAESEILPRVNVFTYNAWRANVRDALMTLEVELLAA